MRAKGELAGSESSGKSAVDFLLTALALFALVSALAFGVVLAELVDLSARVVELEKKNPRVKLKGSH